MFQSQSLNLRESASSVHTRRRKKYEYERLFRRGCSLSCWIYFFSIVLFVSWIIGNSLEYLIIVNSSPLSRFFFFLNPNLFKEIVINGNALTWASGALTLSSFILLVSYILALVSFVLIVCFSVWLFLISYHTSIKIFHYISCLSLFPIFSCFLLTWFIAKLCIYMFYKRFLKRASKFDRDFEPEQFDTPEGKLDDKYLATRSVTTYFGYGQYLIHYKAFQDRDKLSLLKQKLIDFLR